MTFKRGLTAASAALAVMTAGFGALAAQPEPWQMGFQTPVTAIGEQTHALHDILLIMCFAVSAFVLALLIYVVVRFNAKANPVPSKTSHNTLIEVVWTGAPILILIALAFPSFALLKDQMTPPDPEMTIKAVAAQFNWTYTYQDHDDLEFVSNMIPDDEIDPAKGHVRLLSTDQALILPADTNVRVILTADDVIHAFAMPSFTVKEDAVPGRINEIWFKTPSEAKTYYGQCSELCGPAHAFMPIEIKIVAKSDWEAELNALKAEYASNDAANGIEFAAAEE